MDASIVLLTIVGCIPSCLVEKQMPGVFLGALNKKKEVLKLSLEVEVVKVNVHKTRGIFALKKNN